MDKVRSLIILKVMELRMRWRLSMAEKRRQKAARVRERCRVLCATPFSKSAAATWQAETRRIER